MEFKEDDEKDYDDEAEEVYAFVKEYCGGVNIDGWEDATEEESIAWVYENCNEEGIALMEQGWESDYDEEEEA